MQAEPLSVHAADTTEPATMAHAERNGLCCSVAGAPRWLQPDLQQVAERRGHGEALADAWQMFGTDLLEHVGGAFSFSVVDERAGRTMLAVDRMALQNLYFALNPGKAPVSGVTPAEVRRHLGGSAEISAQALFHYLVFWWIPAPLTVFSGLRRVLPGQRILVDHVSGQTEASYYWHMPYDEPSGLAPEDLAASLRERMRIAVERCIEQTDPDTIGVFLSGGLDSSTVAGHFGEAVGRPARTYTIGFAEDGFDESEYAAATARHFGTRHHHYRMTADDFYASLPDIVRCSAEPFANTSIVPVYWCARMARQDGITLMLAGDGGDELFAGNSRYAEETIFEHYWRLPAPLRKLLQTALPQSSSFAPLRKAVSYVNYAKQPLPDRLLAGNFFSTVRIEDVFCDDVLHSLDRAGPFEVMRDAYHRTASRDRVQQMMHLDLKLILADGDLPKVNTACAAAGVYVRYPFLDDDVVELAAQIPSGVLMRGNRLRDFFKRSYAGFLAPETISKKKHGFGMPTMRWMKEHAGLERLALDSARDFSERGYLRRTFLDRVVSEYRHATEDTHASGMLCDIMLLELWLKAHV